MEPQKSLAKYKGNLEAYGAFIIFGLLIILLQFWTLKKHLLFGFTSDDWWYLGDYKSVEHPFLNSLSALKRFGVHFFSRVYAVGILESILGLNFLLMNLVNQLFKLLATLTLFPIIYLVFRNKLLAFLTVLVYSFHFSTLETLEHTSGVADFLAIVFMNLFLVCFYMAIKKNNETKWLILFSISYFLSLIINAIRIYPIIFFLFTLEMFLFSRSKKIKQPAARIFILLLPLLLLLVSPLDVHYSTSMGLGKLTGHILSGNWQLLLAPIGTLGSMFLPSEFWRIFGGFDTASLSTFLEHYLQNVLPVFAIVTAMIGYLMSDSLLKFWVKTMIFNLLFVLVSYFLMFHQVSIDPIVRIHFDPNEAMVGILIGIYISSLVLSLVIENVKDLTKSTARVAIIAGFVFSMAFIVFTWLIANYMPIIWGLFGVLGVHGYLTIPAMGVSLIFAAVLYKLYSKLSFLLKNRLTFIPKIILIILMVMIYQSFTRPIESFLNYDLKHGLRATDQQTLGDNLLQKSGSLSKSEPSFFFIDTTSDKSQDKYYRTVLMGRFDRWLAIIGGLPLDDCFGPVIIVDDKATLLNSFEIRDNQPGFYSAKTCITGEFYNLENLYAYRLEDKQFYDIKPEIIDELKRKKLLN